VSIQEVLSVKPGLPAAARIPVDFFFFLHHQITKSLRRMSIFSFVPNEILEKYFALSEGCHFLENSVTCLTENTEYYNGI